MVGKLKRKRKKSIAQQTTTNSLTKPFYQRAITEMPISTDKILKITGTPEDTYSKTLAWGHKCSNKKGFGGKLKLKISSIGKGEKSKWERWLKK